MEIEQIKDIKLNFILASARTGSTLLSSMFNAHPNVISTSEEPFAYSLYPKYKKISKWTPQVISDFCSDFFLFSEGRLEIQFGTKKDLETILTKYQSNLTAEIAIKLAYLCFFKNKDKSNITTIVDKQLTFHFCLNQIASFYPQSKFIILYRDPRDNALTRKRMHERLNEKIKTYFQIAHSWKYVYGKILQQKSKIGNDKFLEIKYEELVSNPKIELSKICSFLGIQYNEDMLNYDTQVNAAIRQNKELLSTSAKNTLSLLHQGLTEKVNTNKIGFWKQGLKKEEADLIWTICGKLAEKIGYKRHDDFIKQTFKLDDYFTYLSILITRVTTLLYYSSPFFVKYLIKKIKYGKKLKSNRRFS